MGILIAEKHCIFVSLKVREKHQTHHYLTKNDGYSNRKSVPEAVWHLPQLQEEHDLEEEGEGPLLQENRPRLQGPGRRHRRRVRGQEVPLHLRRLHQRKNLQGCRALEQDVED